MPHDSVVAPSAVVLSLRRQGKRPGRGWVIANEADGGRSAEVLIYQGSAGKDSPTLRASFPHCKPEGHRSCSPSRPPTPARGLCLTRSPFRHLPSHVIGAAGRCGSGPAGVLDEGQRWPVRPGSPRRLNPRRRHHSGLRRLAGRKHADPREGRHADPSDQPQSNWPGVEERTGSRAPGIPRSDQPGGRIGHHACPQRGDRRHDPGRAAVEHLAGRADRARSAFRCACRSPARLARPQAPAARAVAGGGLRL